MTCGERVIEWLYSDQLNVDAEWSVRTDRGFTWWAHEQAQTIWVAGEETGPDGEVGYLIAVRTEVLRGIPPSTSVKAEINDLAGLATMSGPVYDEEAGTLELCSLVRVHPTIAHWIQKLISISAIIQLIEAESLADQLVERLAAEAATSGHPQNGLRREPDEILGIFGTVICPLGNEPSRWEAGEFSQACAQYMQTPPAMVASAGGRGVTVEFPFGSHSSLCQFQADIEHPLLGNGLAMRQSFPIPLEDPDEGASLAMLLNRRELIDGPFGYGFGSYHFDQGMIQFLTLLPNFAYQPGLLPNLYFSCAGRAWELSETLAGETLPDATHATEDLMNRLLALRGQPGVE
jgi:hypothetical protein